MNTANKLTLLRVFLAPIFMALLLTESTACRIAALIVFIIASITDCIDGQIARRCNQITTFGKFADPLADKILTTAALLIFLTHGYASVWALMIILAREFMVAGVRLAAVNEGTVIAASFWGKFKTVSQMIVIIVGIILMIINQTIFGIEPAVIVNILVWISTLFTVISGVEYLVKNWHLMKLK